MKFNILIGLIAITTLFACKAQKENVKKDVEKNVELDKPAEAKFNTEEIVGFYEIVFIKDFPEFNETTPTISFDAEGSVKGHGGCNSYFGKLEPTKNNVLGNIGATRMACEGEKNDVEQKLMNLFNEITNIELVEDGSLNFLSDMEVVIKAKEPRLDGEFRVFSLNSKALKNEEISFTIDEGQMNGNTGCNSFMGPIVQNGFNISLQEISATEMVCEDYDMKTESEFLSVLTKIEKYRVNQDKYDFYIGNKVMFSAIRN